MTSPLGDSWVPLYNTPVTFQASHFETAMANLIHNPNINSTVIMRADILREKRYEATGTTSFVSAKINEPPVIPGATEPILTRYLDATEFQRVPVAGNFAAKREILRRIIPRNPFKDCVINQTCLVWERREKENGRENENENERENENENEREKENENESENESRIDGEAGDTNEGTGKLQKGTEKDGSEISMGELEKELGKLDKSKKSEKLEKSDSDSNKPDSVDTGSKSKRVDSNKPDSVGSVLVIYIPHIQHPEETPFYIPPVKAIGILYEPGRLSIHYYPFPNTDIRSMDPNDRSMRIAQRLLQTSAKHSFGVFQGYEKRVNHDLVVDKESFQNTYIALKKKYSAALVEGWVENTDPKKHVFEDLAIAAFLISFWGSHARFEKNSFEFRDLGCGNGLLVHILLSEGYKGHGVDARRRKSWKTYPQHVQKCLHEQIVIPSVLLKPHPSLKQVLPGVNDNGRVFRTDDQVLTADSLLRSDQVCTTEDFPENTFLIGNHSDELTCWIPLLGFPFLVIPCCSHGLDGARRRYPGKGKASAYAALVDHVEELARYVGWEPKREMLRIPSTRNAAIVGVGGWREERVWGVMEMEGVEGWVENSMGLMKREPRSH